MALAGYVEDGGVGGQHLPGLPVGDGGPAVLVIHEVAGEDAGGVRDSPTAWPTWEVRTCCRACSASPAAARAHGGGGDAPGHPTRAALERLLQLFQDPVAGCELMGGFDREVDPSRGGMNYAYGLANLTRNGPLRVVRFLCNVGKVQAAASRGQVNVDALSC